MRRTGSRHHLAVVDGPDAGWVAALPDDGVVTVGRAADAVLCLADPAMSRHHVAVRARAGRVRVRALRPGVTVRRARRRRRGGVRLARPRRMRRRWQEVTSGARVLAGGTTLEIRDHPGMAAPDPPGETVTDGLGMRLLVPLAMAATMIPLALSSAISSPWRTVTWLVLPLVLVIAVLWPWLRERAAQRLRRRREREAADEPPPPLDPAAVLATVDHPWRGRAVEWDLGTVRRRPRGQPAAVPPPAPGHGLALLGPPEAVASMARWLVCQLAHRHPPADLALVLPACWDWASPLPHRDEGAVSTVVVLDRTDTTVPAPPLAPGAVGVVLASSLASVPPWCTAVIEIPARHDRRVSTAWAHEITTALRAAVAQTDELPAVVHLDDLLGAPDPAAVLARWRRRPHGLAATLGTSGAGPVGLDLAADGPHALVAGTTGSGKSELLTTWVIGLALAHPPADLHVLLVDYKGGATFGVLGDLPHVLDVLTDLDTAGTARALASLRAELARRERVLAAAAARSVTELAEDARMPRLLIVVDEFRTMADSHPDLLDGLVRLAAQGRSLGVHLVLATQRPGGAVTADMRANISVRLCLRVLESTDSIDVLGDADAARLPAVPGRAVLRTTAAVTLQVAWPGTATGGVAGWVGRVVGAAALAASDDPRDGAVEGDAALVTATPPWAPPLTSGVSTSELGPGSAAALPLLLTDRPERQRLEGWHLPLGDLLVVSGPPRSGRTQTVRTIAVEALRRGVITHAIADEEVLPLGAAAAGTRCGTEDTRRVPLLLAALQSRRADRAELLVVDDVDALVQALDAALGFGTGAELVLGLLRAARRSRLGVVLTAAPPATRWAAAAHAHLVLAPRELTDSLVAGVPRALVQTHPPPGRGVLLTGGDAVVGQVAVVTEPLDGGGVPPSGHPLRILPLPTLVDLPPGTGARTPPGEGVLVGLGGTDCSPVRASLPHGGVWLVLGGARSGRSTAMATIGARLAAAGRPVWTDPAAAAADPRADASGVLLLDDVDRMSPAAVRAAADLDHLAVVATARPEPLAAAFHDLARRLRDPDVTLVLGHPAGTAPWVGGDLRGLVDTTPHVGRGVLVAAGRRVPLQVDRCSPQRTVSALADGRLVAATDAGSSSPTPTTTDAATAV